jgi:acetate kinase
VTPGVQWERERRINVSRIVLAHFAEMSTPFPSSTADVRHVLTINSGSSSVKFALYDRANLSRRLATGIVERIGSSNSHIKATATEEGDKTDESIEAATHHQAIRSVLDWLSSHGFLGGGMAVGHRVVHGGERFVDAVAVDAEVVRLLRELTPLAPNHLPGEIAAIEAVMAVAPEASQFASFDTAFHRHLPAEAKRIAIPRRYADAGVRRYGFHGISYSYLMRELERIAGRETVQERVVLAHLGAGCSMAAVRDGVCIDTTMGFTPMAGLVMATRAGDLDPGVLIHLARTEGLSPEQLEELVARKSGLLGVSETSSDIRDLLASENHDLRAAEALSLFCHQARKWIGALAAALGGLESLVFSAGIGENSPDVRARICTGLHFLGIELDVNRNDRNEALISMERSRVAVRVIPTDEEAMIAIDVATLLTSSRHESTGESPGFKQFFESGRGP